MEVFCEYLHKSFINYKLFLKTVIGKISSITIFLSEQYNGEWELKQMNIKDIANIRKQFKLNNDLIEIREIFNVYIQKESGDIYHHICQPFQMLEKEEKELFLANFKKVLTGSLDAKLFELKFQHDVEDSTQTILFEGLQAESTEYWKENMLQIVGKLFANTTYEFDTVVTFIRGEYRKPIENGIWNQEKAGMMKSILTSLSLAVSIKRISRRKPCCLIILRKNSNRITPLIQLLI